MFCYKKKSGGLQMIMTVAGVVLAMAAAGYAIYLFCKKCKCTKKSIFPNLNLGLCFDDGEMDSDFGCVVPDTNDDVRSDENAVVNSENRTINTPNPLMEE